MVKLSVNVNKVATLRNARGEDVPNVLQAALTCVKAGAHGITVHPREDQRHIKPEDVFEIASAVDVEFNIEGDARPDLIEMVLEVKPAQCTLVPVTPGEVTSDHGWNLKAEGDTLEPIIAKLTRAPCNDAPIGGLKVITQKGWFAARPTGTEDVYKVYAESFKGPAHLRTLQEEARAIVAAAFKAAGVE